MFKLFRNGNKNLTGSCKKKNGNLFESTLLLQGFSHNI